MKPKDIVILVGGKGSRPGKITNVTAKQIVEVKFPWYIINKY